MSRGSVMHHLAERKTNMGLAEKSSSWDLNNSVIWDIADKDGDGVLTKDEFDRVYNHLKAEAQREARDLLVAEADAAKAKSRAKVFLITSAVLVAFLALSLAGNLGIVVVTVAKFKDQYVESESTEAAKGDPVIQDSSGAHVGGAATTFKVNASKLIELRADELHAISACYFYKSVPMTEGFYFNIKSTLTIQELVTTNVAAQGATVMIMRGAAGGHAIFKFDGSDDLESIAYYDPHRKSVGFGLAGVTTKMELASVMSERYTALETDTVFQDLLAGGDGLEQSASEARRLAALRPIQSVDDIVQRDSDARFRRQLLGDNGCPGNIQHAPDAPCEPSDFCASESYSTYGRRCPCCSCECIPIGSNEMYNPGPAIGKAMGDSNIAITFKKTPEGKRRRQLSAGLSKVEADHFLYEQDMDSLTSAWCVGTMPSMVPRDMDDELLSVFQMESVA